MITADKYKRSNFGIYVDETENKIYVVSDNALYELWKELENPTSSDITDFTDAIKTQFKTDWNIVCPATISGSTGTAISVGTKNANATNRAVIDALDIDWAPYKLGDKNIRTSGDLIQAIKTYVADGVDIAKGSHSTSSTAIPASIGINHVGSYLTYIAAVNLSDAGTLTYTYGAVYLNGHSSSGSSTAASNASRVITNVKLSSTGRLAYTYIDSTVTAGTEGTLTDINATDSAAKINAITGLTQGADGKITYAYTPIYSGASHHSTDNTVAIGTASGINHAGSTITYISGVNLSTTGTLTYTYGSVKLSNHSTNNSAIPTASSINTGATITYISGVNLSATGALSYTYGSVKLNNHSSVGTQSTTPPNSRQLIKDVNLSSTGKLTYTYTQSVGATFYVSGASRGEVFNDYTGNTASGGLSHAEGGDTTATGTAAHAEGWATSASGNGSHSEGQADDGYSITASGIGSHAEGHAETGNISASGNGAHAEGDGTTASGAASHAEGVHTQAIGVGSHTGGENTIASNRAQTSIGCFNVETENTIFAVGNGTSNSARSNAFEVENTGNTYVGGTLYGKLLIPAAKSTTTSTANTVTVIDTLNTSSTETLTYTLTTVPTKKYVDNKITNIQGTYASTTTYGITKVDTSTIKFSDLNSNYTLGIDIVDGVIKLKATRNENASVSISGGGIIKNGTAIQQYKVTANNWTNISATKITVSYAFSGGVSGDSYKGTVEVSKNSSANILKPTYSGNTAVTCTISCSVTGVSVGTPTTTTNWSDILAYNNVSTTISGATEYGFSRNGMSLVAGCRGKYVFAPTSIINGKQLSFTWGGSPYTIPAMKTVGNYTVFDLTNYGDSDTLVYSKLE